jgi:hypothetical protein
MRPAAPKESQVAKSTPSVPKGEFVRRVREELNASFNWEVGPRTAAKRTSKAAADLRSFSSGLPFDPVPNKPASPAKGRPKSTAHDKTTLRRAAQGFALVTLREGKQPHVYEDDSPVWGENQRPLIEREFARLSKFLVPGTGDRLFDPGPPQHFNVRRAR